MCRFVQKSFGHNLKNVEGKELTQKKSDEKFRNMPGSRGTLPEVSPMPKLLAPPTKIF